MWRKNPQGIFARQPFATFGVGTPSVTLIDNEDPGVEFGVEVDPSGTAYAHVFRGRILCQFAPPRRVASYMNRDALDRVTWGKITASGRGPVRNTIPCAFPRRGKEPPSFALDLPKLPVYSLNGASQKREEGRRNSAPN